MNRRDLDRLVDEEVALGDHAGALARTGFWGRRGAGVVFLARDTGRLLLALRSSRVLLEPHTWGTWGGAVDPGESLEEAARREVAEESGYDGAYDLVPLYVFRSGDFTYSNYLAVVDREFTPRLDWETDDYAWVPLDDLPKPLHFGLRVLLDDPVSLAKIRRAAGSSGQIDALHTAKTIPRASLWLNPQTTPVVVNLSRWFNHPHFEETLRQYGDPVTEVTVHWEPYEDFIQFGFDDAADWEFVGEVARRIQAGADVPPLLRWHDDTFDGHHRAFAAKKAGIRLAPVVEFALAEEVA